MRQQPLGHRHQQLIANVMAKGIVDRLESVEIDKQHRKFGFSPRGFLHGLAETIFQQQTVGQLGQVVMQG